MGSNLLLRGAKESFASRLGEGEVGPGLRDPTVTVSLLPLLHSFTITLRTPFWIHAPDQSLSRLVFVLCLCNFVKRRECSSHLLFVCPLLTVRFKTLSRTLISSQLKWVLRMALVRSQLWIRLPSRIWFRSTTLERRRTLLLSLDDSQGCATPFGFSKKTCITARTCISSQHNRCLNFRTQSSSRSSRRVRAGGQNQRIATCSGLRSPRSNGLARSGAARCRPTGSLESQQRQAQGRFTA